MECLDAVTIERLNLEAVRVNLLPLLQKAMEDSEEAKIKSPPKKKWWPVLATKRSSRFQGNATIMEKAEAYLMKKNLEISRTFKGQEMEKHKGCMG